MYTYAFFKPPITELAFPKGILGSVQLIESAQLCALVEPELHLEDLENDDRRLVQAAISHDRVIRYLFQQITLLPLRFGTYFTSKQSLLNHLEVQAPLYLEKLAEFEGKAEYSLTVNPLKSPDVSIDADSRGKEYFLAKKKQFQIQQEFQNRQAEELKQIMQVVLSAQQLNLIARIHPQLPNSAHSDSGKIFLLADQANQSILVEHVQTLQLQCSTWQIMLDEPLPPYHFLEN